MVSKANFTGCLIMLTSKLKMSSLREICRRSEKSQNVKWQYKIENAWHEFSIPALLSFLEDWVWLLPLLLRPVPSEALVLGAGDMPPPLPKGWEVGWTPLRKTGPSVGEGGGLAASASTPRDVRAGVGWGKELITSCQLLVANYIPHQNQAGWKLMQDNYIRFYKKTPHNWGCFLRSQTQFFHNLVVACDIVFL